MIPLVSDILILGFVVWVSIMGYLDFRYRSAPNFMFLPFFALAIASGVNEMISFGLTARIFEASVFSMILWILGQRYAFKIKTYQVGDGNVGAIASRGISSSDVYILIATVWIIPVGLVLMMILMFSYGFAYIYEATYSKVVPYISFLAIATLIFVPFILW